MTVQSLGAVLGKRAGRGLRRSCRRASPQHGPRDCTATGDLAGKTSGKERPWHQKACVHGLHNEHAKPPCPATHNA